MNLSQIQSNVLAWLDDENQGYFNANDVLNWVNNACYQTELQMIQAGNNWFMKPVETYTVYQQADYLWPSDFLVEHRIEVVLSGTGTSENRQALVPITTNMQDLIPITSGVPSNYYIKKDRFTMSPVPDQGGPGPSGSYLTRLYYSYLIPQLVNPTDVPDIPTQFHEYICLLAAYNGFIKDDRAPANLVAKLEQYETLMKQSLVDRTQDLARQVVQVQDYDMNAWWW